MARIDAHQHFWCFEPVRDAWITEDMGAIQRNFLPSELQLILQQHAFEGCVAVQASQSETETSFLLGLASQYSFIKGVVGWVDLRADNIHERLAHYRRCAPLKGFRHVLQGETDRALMLRPEFWRGLAALDLYGFTFDLLILPDQLGYAAELAAAFPSQRFVLDHLAKPFVKTGEIEPWRRDVMALATHENVWCKMSGLVTEADWQHGQAADFRPYLDVAFEAFGPRRLMFGSDWPVCNVAGGYGCTLGLVADYLSAFSPDEQRQFWGDNAVSFYDL